MIHITLSIGLSNVGGPHSQGRSKQPLWGLLELTMLVAFTGLYSPKNDLFQNIRLKHKTGKTQWASNLSVKIVPRKPPKNSDLELHKQ